MSLDPQIAAMLAATANAPSLTSLPPEQARAVFEQVAARLQAAAAPLPEVARTDDVDAGGVPVRVYRPRPGEHDDAAGTRPTVVFAHGGGWVIGSLDTHDDLARRLTHDLGAVVVSVDYRLAPEHRFPAAVDDCVTALEWVVEHVGELGGDPSRVAVAGDSAGGNLAAVLAQHARDTGRPLAAQLLVYPATDLGTRHPSLDENADGLFLTRAYTEYFGRSYLGDDAALLADPRVSPRRAATLAGLAPAVVVTARYDPIRDDGDAYAEALAAAGVPVTHRTFDGLVHGFFGMNGVSAAAEDAVAWTTAAFARLLAG